MVKQNKQSLLYSVSRKVQNDKVLNFTRAQQFRISSYLSKRPSKLYPYETSKGLFSHLFVGFFDSDCILQFQCKPCKDMLYIYSKCVECIVK